MGQNDFDVLYRQVILNELNRKRERGVLCILLHFRLGENVYFRIVANITFGKFKNTNFRPLR